VDETNDARQIEDNEMPRLRYYDVIENHCMNNITIYGTISCILCVIGCIGAIAFVIYAYINV